MQNGSPIQYRWLTGPELSILEPILDSMNAMALNRQTTRAIGAFQGERLIGFFCLQFIPHLEPLYVDPEFRNAEISKTMVSEMVRFLRESDARGVMIVAEYPGIEKLAQSFGMSRIEYPFYSKVNMGGGL